MAKKDMAKINGDKSVHFSYNFSEKQNMAYSSSAQELFFGGSKGSGKSHLIRYASILYSLAVPGLQTYLFRRTSKQVRSNHLFGSTGYINVLQPFIDAGKVDINQSDGRIDFFHKDDDGNSLPTSSIFLRHCQHESDVEVYRGCEIHFLIMDELTHFTSYQYKTLRSCVRLGLKIDYKRAQEILTFFDSEGNVISKAEAGFFPKILCASNPGNIGFKWPLVA